MRNERRVSSPLAHGSLCLVGLVFVSFLRFLLFSPPCLEWLPLDFTGNKPEQKRGEREREGREEEREERSGAAHVSV